MSSSRRSACADDGTSPATRCRLMRRGRCLAGTRVTVRLAAKWRGQGGETKSGLENLEKRSAWKARCHTPHSAAVATPRLLLDHDRPRKSRPHSCKKTTTVESLRQTLFAQSEQTPRCAIANTRLRRGRPQRAIGTGNLHLLQHFDHETEVMGASFPNVRQILELVGCDLVTISPELMKQLFESYEPIERKLTPEKARSANVKRLELEPGLRRGRTSYSPPQSATWRRIFAVVEWRTFPTRHRADPRAL